MVANYLTRRLIFGLELAKVVAPCHAESRLAAEMGELARLMEALSLRTIPAGSIMQVAKRSEPAIQPSSGLAR